MYTILLHPLHPSHPKQEWNNKILRKQLLTEDSYLSLSPPLEGEVGRGLLGGPIPHSPKYPNLYPHG